jgi:hypothetical protein
VQGATETAHDGRLALGRRYSVESLMAEHGDAKLTELHLTLPQP